MTINLDIFNYADITERLDSIPLRWNVKALEELKGSGGASFSILNDDYRNSLLTERSVVKFGIDGKYQSAMVVDKNEPLIIDNTEYEGAKTTYSGKGLKSFFGDAIVYPQGGVFRGSGETRAFNFSTLYPATGDPGVSYTNPVHIAKYGKQTTNPWRFQPAHWPDVPEAFWIWNTNTTTPAEGVTYFVFQQNLGGVAGDKYSFFLAAETVFEVYVDGVMVQEADIDVANWADTVRVNFRKSPGLTTIGVKVYNQVTTQRPRAGFIGALFRDGVASKKTKAKLISYTGDSKWKCLGYPVVQPSHTFGEILITLIDEAIVRGVRLGYFTPSFTGTHDSNGVPWERKYDFTFSVGQDSYLDVFDMMEELGCDIWVDPHTNQLHAAKERGTDKSIGESAIDLRPGKDILKAAQTTEYTIKNSLLVSNGEKFSVKKDNDSVAKYGVIEDNLEVSAPSDIAELIAGNTVKMQSSAEIGASYEILDREGKIPGEDYSVGDYILAPEQEIGKLKKRRVSSMSIEEDQETAKVNYSLEFDNIFLDKFTQLDRWSKMTFSGNIEGSVANARASTKSTAAYGSGLSPSAGPSPGPTPDTARELEPNYTGWGEDLINYPKATIFYKSPGVAEYTFAFSFAPIPFALDDGQYPVYDPGGAEFPGDPNAIVYSDDLPRPETIDLRYRLYGAKVNDPQSPAGDFEYSEEIFINNVDNSGNVLFHSFIGEGAYEERVVEFKEVPQVVLKIDKDPVSFESYITRTMWIEVYAKSSSGTEWIWVLTVPISPSTYPYRLSNAGLGLPPKIKFDSITYDVGTENLVGQINQVPATDSEGNEIPKTFISVHMGDGPEDPENESSPVVPHYLYAYGAAAATSGLVGDPDYYNKDRFSGISPDIQYNVYTYLPELESKLNGPVHFLNTGDNAGFNLANWDYTIEYWVTTVPPKSDFIPQALELAYNPNLNPTDVWPKTVYPADWYAFGNIPCYVFSGPLAFDWNYASNDPYPPMPTHLESIYFWGLNPEPYKVNPFPAP